MDAAERLAVNEALQLYQQGDAEAAWRRLATLPAGADPEAEWARAVTAMATGRHREAAHAAAAVLASLPVRAEAAELLAQAAQAAGDPALARQGLASARQGAGAAPQDGLRLAALELAAGELAAALARLESLAARWPGNPSLLLAAGTVLHRAGRSEEAEAWYRRVLAVGGLDPQAEDSATRQLAAACQAGGRPDEAERLWRGLLERRPGDVEALRNLGTLLKDRDRLAEAPACYRQAMVIGRRRLTTAEVETHARDPAALRTTRHKLKLELEQLEHLAALGCPMPDLHELVNAYRAVHRQLAAQASTGHRVVLSPDQYRQVGSTLHRLVHEAPAPRMAGAALNAAIDFAAVEARYLSHPPGLVVVDRFLEEEAVEALRRYCLESTIWFDGSKAGGYCGAYLDDGFGCPLLLQLAEELRAAMPRLLGPLHLEHQWAYLYDQSLTGITAHADPARVNLNFWLTPDEANLDPDSGGLVVWTREAPREWDFDEYNNRPEAIEAFAAGSGKVVVPHRRNRLVMFNSNLVHKTDDFRFRPGFENRRLNLTMLFGRRGRG